MEKVPVAIIGSGNIGTDLMVKLASSSYLQVIAVIGIDVTSPGLKKAEQLGYVVGHNGLSDFLETYPQNEIAIFFDATSAKAHLDHYQLIKARGSRIIDMTPAAIGPFVVPSVNLTEQLQMDNLNLITCGGQATIPMVAAISQVSPISYAEIVATIASASAGAGTRENIDEFTETTARALEQVGGAAKGKAIIILNPADPPVVMRDTVRVLTTEIADEKAIRASIDAMEKRVQSYVPGYHLYASPIFSGREVTLFIEVIGAGDFLPTYAGNLDIMTAAGVKVAEEIVKKQPWEER